MIAVAAIFLIIALFLYFFSHMMERPWLKWWMIPFILLAAAIMTGKFTGVI